MPAKTPSLIAGLSTFFLMIALTVTFVFGQIVLLNGASESDAFNALVVSVICQSVVLLLAVILARWLANLLITKFQWNKALAVVTAVIAGTGLGALFSFLSIILSTLFAGIR
jgi:hypothetical protein